MLLDLSCLDFSRKLNYAKSEEAVGGSPGAHSCGVASGGWLDHQYHITYIYIYTRIYVYNININIYTYSSP